MTKIKEGVQKLIMRMLLYRELSGYELYKELSAKSIRVRPNYLYMILAEMNERGVLKGRWIERRTGPRRHLYSLSEKGKEVFSQLLKDSLGLIMDAFVYSNLTATDLPDHLNSIRATFRMFDVPYPAAGSRVVLTTPSFDPLVCYPIAFRLWSETFPGASVVVVKPKEVKLYDERPNLSYVDGYRHDMPFKEGFADYVVLEGFPKEVREADTIHECARVLNDDGNLIIRVPDVMTEEKRPKATNFAEFATKLYYDTFEPDRVVSTEGVKRILSRYFVNPKEAAVRSNIVFYAGGKRETSAHRIQLGHAEAYNRIRVR